MRKNRNGHRNRNIQKLPRFRHIQPRVIDHQKDLFLANLRRMRSTVMCLQCPAAAKERQKKKKDTHITCHSLWLGWFQPGANGSRRF